MMSIKERTMAWMNMTVSSFVVSLVMNVTDLLPVL